MIDLTRYFGGAFVLNLDSRPERFDSFSARARNAGISGFSRYRAIHGESCKPPHWWKTGGPSWGCLMSHLRVAQDAIMNGLESYLVFEDDAIFVPDFADRLVGIMERLEGVEWDQLYLGGQHMHMESGPPWPFRKEIVHGRDITRTHAFAVNARFMEKFVQHIMHFPDYVKSYREWGDSKVEGRKHWHMDHIDHHLGSLHRKREHVILAANPWLCGQAEGPSDILGKDKEEMWWPELGWG